MKLNRAYFFLVLLAVVICYFYIDFPLALWIERHIRSYPTFRQYSSNLPSKLLLLVVLISSYSWIMYAYLRWKKPHYNRDFFLLLGSVLPAAYLLKTLLKWVFGRLETRLWLQQPDAYAMHWFNGVNGYDAFPSGHMLVLMPLFLAVWYFYPRLRHLVMLACSGLALALLATNYHFLSDVIAGSYIGMLSYFAVAHALKIRHE